eukprot:GHRR01024527.1.p1 GENE.GHRR01024527.1~~GHRR01024527.1.p1  ORF type:complete len:329 (+),score=129.03 GHRR01024527.1:26-988(+)
MVSTRGTVVKAEPQAEPAATPAPDLLTSDQSAGTSEQRPSLPVIRFSQEEAALMTERVQELEAAGDDALDRALDLGIDRAVLNNLVSRVVRFMLFRNYEKPEVPVKQQDLANLWQKEQQIGRHARKLPGIVVPMAAAKLATTFGLEMRELGGVHKPAAADAGTAVAGGSGMAASGNGAASSQKMFVLRSMLPQALVQKFVQDPADDPVRGLMTVILALIQLSEGSMEADALWRDLRKMGVDKDGSANCFGKKGAAGVVANMKKSRYIASKKRVTPAGEQQLLYVWGENATDEFGGSMNVFIDRWLADGGPNGLHIAGMAS